MKEARSLQYSINVRANVKTAERDIQNLISQCGRLRSEAAGVIGVEADTERAQDDIQNLADSIGSLGEPRPDIKVDADTSEAEQDVQNLTKSIVGLGENPPDIKVDADTSEAEQDIRNLTKDIGSLGESSLDTKIGVDTADAEENIKKLTESSDSLRQTISQQESEMKKLKQSYVDMAQAGDTTSQEAASLTDQISNLGSELQENKVRLKNTKDAADQLSHALNDVGDSADQAEPDIEDLGDAAEKSSGKFEKLGGIIKGIGKVAAVGLTAATVAVGGFAASSVNVGMTFDSSMSQVAATMGYTVAELNDSTSEASQNFSKLRDFAMEMGANTAFSASQSADALNYMALAGYDAETSMKMLPNVLNLAAAGGIELAAASDMVTDAQSALGLSLDETSELVDKMAAASSKSNTSVQQLGDAILTVGGTAKNLAGGTTELSTALGILADNGTKGAEGGTALRNIILSLSAPTDKAAAQLEALGVQAFDVEGNLRPLNETFGDLNGALSSLTQEQQTQALSEIFNKVDLKSVNAMLGTSSERWYELGTAIDGAWVSMDSLSDSLSDVGLDLTTMQGNLSKLGVSESDLSDMLKISGGNAELFAEALLEAADAGVTQSDIISALGGNLEDLQTAFDNTTGAASNMADTQLDNLAGDITLFKSALEGAQIVISDELSPSLREFTQFGTGAITELSEAFQEGGLTGAMGALGSVLGEGLSMIIGKLPVAIDAGMQLIGAFGQGLLDNAPMIIDAAIQIVTMLGDSILSGSPVLTGSAMQIVAALASGLGSMLPTLLPAAVEAVAGIASALVVNSPLMIDAGMQLISGLADGIIGAIPVLAGQLPELIDQILGCLSDGLPMILEQGSTILLSLTDGLVSEIPSLVEMLPEIITSICGFVTDNLPTILEQGVLILTSLAVGILSALPELIGQVPAIISGVIGTLSENFPAIVSAGVTLLLEFGSGIISAIPSLVSQLPAIGAAILGVLSTIPGMVIGVGKSIVEGLWSGISSMVGWIGSKVKGFASGIVNGIKGFLGIHSPSTVFAEIGDNMALGLGGGFGRSMKGVTETMKGIIPTSLDGPKIKAPGMDYAGYGVLSGLSDSELKVPDVTYGVHPVIGSINPPKVQDMTFTVSPLVDDFNPPGDEADADGNTSESVPDNEASQANGSPGSEGSYNFAPVVNFEISVQGNADYEVIEKLRSELTIAFEDRVRALYEEFREEELHRLSLKNQYAF